MNNDKDRDAERSMEQADEANGEAQTDDGVNDTEKKYGDDESPA